MEDMELTMDVPEEQLNDPVYEPPPPNPAPTPAAFHARFYTPAPAPAQAQAPASAHAHHPTLTPAPAPYPAHAYFYTPTPAPTPIHTYTSRDAPPPNPAPAPFPANAHFYTLAPTPALAPAPAPNKPSDAPPPTPAPASYPTHAQFQTPVYIYTQAPAPAPAHAHYPNPTPAYAPQPQAHFPTPNAGFTTGLCDGFNDIPLFCMTCWCPCITFGRIAEIVDKGSTSCGVGGALYILIFAFTGCQCIYSCAYRSKMRAQFGMPEDLFGDCCIHTWCEQCALCQEYIELQRRGYDLTLGWQGNMAKQVMMPPPIPSGMIR